MHGSQPSSVLRHDPVLSFVCRSVPRPQVWALCHDLIKLEMYKSKAVGKLPLYGLISPGIPLVGYSFGDGEREEACEVTQSSEAGIDSLGVKG